jgi:subtilisin family serine protease
MKRECIASVVLAVLVISFALSAFAGEIEPNFAAYLETLSDDDFASAIVYLQDRPDIKALDNTLHVEMATMEERHQRVITALKQAAERSQPLFLDYLDGAVAASTVKGYTPYWIMNLVVVSAAKAELYRIAERPEVEAVEGNFKPTLIEPITGPSGPPIAGIGVTNSLKAINADRVWNELGITGYGRLIGGLDTGVDGDHAALTDRWRGNWHPWQECWRDAVGYGTTYPVDYNGHGSHTMGTMCGVGYGTGDTVGVAWEAQWIADNSIDQGVGSEFDNDVLGAFQWFTDPDGDPGTTDDVPDVVQNSWGIDARFGGTYQDCDYRWQEAIEACEAAGVVVTFSAGNEGPNPQTHRSPANICNSPTVNFSVGAVDAEYSSWPFPICSFSSRGPSDCDGVTIKPEVVAPGYYVYSSYNNGGYTRMSGTSMAGPHVAGVVALMRQANPNADVQTIKEVLMNTARDLGTTGEDNDYGWGCIDAYEAVLAVMVTDTIPPAAVTDLAAATGSGNGEVDLTWTAPGDDGNTGQASTYDIRYVPYANGPIDTEAEWDGATQVTGEPAPAAAGTPESFTVGGLTPGASYYFVLKTADEIPNWSDLSNSPWAEAGEVPYVQDYANQDILVDGTVYNDYTYTHASDNSYEYIEEVESKGNPATRKSLLEHKWTIDVTGGSSVTFCVEAHQTASADGDNFTFSYSTDNSTYYDLVTVSATSDEVYSVAMPSSVSGMVYIRVKDTDRTPGNRNLDRIYIDQMFIESSSIPDTIPPEVTVTIPNGGESWYAGTIHTITWNATDNMGISSTDIDYTYDGGSTWYDVADLSGNPGSYDWTVPNTPSSQCLVKITCYDAASNSDYDVSDGYFTILESVEKPMFVESISMSSKIAGPNFTAYARPKVVEDATGYPALEGVTIYGHWYGETSDFDQCITGADGTCEVESDKIKDPTQQFCFQVDSLVKENYFWDESKGVDHNCINPGAALAKNTPIEFGISQNYPNPFNPETKFSIDLTAATQVKFVVYNVAGQVVRTLVDGVLPAGSHTITWDGTNQAGQALSSGVYFYRVIAGGEVVTRKMTLLK